MAGRRSAAEHSLREPFDAALFVARLQAGMFDGHLHQELAKLSHEQLEQVAKVLARQFKRNKP